MTRKSKTLRLVGLAVMAAAAISALMAGPALAAKSGHQWTVGEAKLLNGESAEVVPSLMSEKATLTGTVQNQAFKMTATGLECSGTCKIEQVIEGETARAIAKGKLKFTGITVDEPVGCKSTETITTEELTAELVTHVHKTEGKADETQVYALFKPVGTTFAKVTLTGCAAAETYPVKGSVCGRTDPIETMTVNQPVTFSPATNGTCAAGAGLTLGGKAANIEGEATNTLKSGASWGALTYK